MLTVSVRKVLTNKKHSFWEVKAPLLHCNNYAFTRQKLCFHFVITMLLQNDCHRQASAKDICSVFPSPSYAS